MPRKPSPHSRMLLSGSSFWVPSSVDAMFDPRAMPEAKSGVARPAGRALIGFGLIGESQWRKARVAREEAVALDGGGRGVLGMSVDVVPGHQWTVDQEPFARYPTTLVAFSFRHFAAAVDMAASGGITLLRAKSVLLAIFCLSLLLSACSTSGDDQLPNNAGATDASGDVGPAQCLGSVYPDLGVIDPDDPTFSDGSHSQSIVEQLFSEAKAGNTNAYRAYKAASLHAEVLDCAFCTCGCASSAAAHRSGVDCFKDMHGFT
jgi:hypothetical protein